MLAVILAILGLLNDKPLTSFDFGVNVNALVNVASQVGQTALLVPVASSISQLKWIWLNGHGGPMGTLEDFDMASRGLMGCLVLMFRCPKM